MSHSLRLEYLHYYPLGKIQIDNSLLLRKLLNLVLNVYADIYQIYQVHYEDKDA